MTLNWRGVPLTAPGGSETRPYLDREAADVGAALRAALLGLSRGERLSRVGVSLDRRIGIVSTQKAA